MNLENNIENKNDTKIVILKDLKNIIENFNILKNKKECTSKELDDFRWNINRSQLLTLKELNISEEELTNYIATYKMEDIFLNDVLEEIVKEKMEELVNKDDINDKILTTTISLDKDFNRQVEVKLLDPDDEYALELLEQNGLPELNPVIKKQIEDLCKQMLFGILEDEDLEDFIKDRYLDYEEVPYTIDFLEGYIEGYISNL